MDGQHTHTEPLRFSDPRQQRIHDLLLLIGPGPAAFYRDACRIMQASVSSPFETTTHLVGHLLREIESALRAVVSSAAEHTEPPSRRTRQGTHRREIIAILKGLGIEETEPVAQAWLRIAMPENEEALHRRAHRDALSAPRPADAPFHAFWNEMEGILFVVLTQFEARFLKGFALLDTLIDHPSPGKAEVDRLRNYVPNTLVTLQYFFDKLMNPAWIQPLWEHHFFRNPVEPIYDHEQGTINIPPWPASRYLVRMVTYAEVQALVLTIALQIRETENVRVSEDLTDIALTLPAHLGVQLVPQVKRGLDSPYHSVLPHKLGALVSRLAQGGQREAALDLAHALFMVLPDPRAEEEDYSLVPEPRARFDPWWYERGLRTHAPDLVATAGVDALRIFCELLDTALRLSRRQEQESSLDDYSSAWRPSIEDSHQNQPQLYPVKNSLVSAVRNAAEQLVMADVGGVPALIDILEERSWPIFQRLALHLLRRFPQAPTARALIAERLTDHRRFEARDLQHEYVLLGREHFGALSADEQATILDWIVVGPDLHHMKVMAEGSLGRVPTDEELDRYARVWRRDRLAWFLPGLPPVWQRSYEDLVATFGEPEHPEFSVYLTGGAYTPTSPKSIEDLQGMRIEELVTFLRTWQPSGDRVASSPEGLGQILAGVVAAAPERFAAEARCFQDLDPTYVRALLTGLHQAVKQQRGFAWTPVLALCCWVGQQPRESLAQENAFLFRDTGWDWTRTTILDLLLDGFRATQAAIPLPLRPAVWDILQPLADDPDPTPEREAQSADAHAAPLTLSVPTTRGKALEAVLAYARWVQQQHTQGADSEEHTSCSLADIPEVCELLDRHLDASHHPSFSICALYGMRFPQLFVLDRAWTTARISRIFPTEDTWRTLREAAWENYVTHWPPYDDLFEVLYDEYSRAVDSIGVPPPQWHRAANPEEALALHLMSFYQRGQIDLDDPEGLLMRFYAKATDPLCAYALEVIGRGLGREPTEVPSEVLERLRTLWEWRLAGARISSPAHHAKELAAFGWWFTSAKFDPVWAMAQLTETLELVGKAELEHLVIQRLAILASDMPVQTIECVRLLCEGDKEGWMIQTWDESIRTVLTTGMQSAEVSAQEAAVALINILSTRGHLSFRDLLGSEHNPNKDMESS